ncbi:hypothetical protein [Chryseobacterium sp. KLBC 52]|uniref:hypothetical protein n=1 Tax=Chryseobacterium sp. KLBC 52 TaxID=1862702 RepID=UPI0013B37462|nr:hypothetical protein [Chryseobacterium sp. KLBC 52]
MNNLRKLTKSRLRTINGGEVWCPAKPITSCSVWCGLTKEQKMRCLLDVEGCECF